MQNFLEKFNGTIKNRQTQQILKILNKRKLEGGIRNFNEFRVQFETLMAELADETIAPSTIFYPAIPLNEISVETHNEMLLRIQNDLSASFEELEKIAQVQNNHEAIVRDLLLKNLRSGMNELRTKINLYRFLNGNGLGFEEALYSTFNGAIGERTNRGATVPNKLFLDQRNQRFLTSIFDAEIDVIGEQLRLSSKNKKRAGIGEVKQILGGHNKISEFNLHNYLENDMDNIIDSLNGTYWNHTIRRKKDSETVYVTLEFFLNGTRELNYLELEPSLTPFHLREIRYKKQDGTLAAIPMEQLLINKDTRISFSTISTDRFQLVFEILNNTYAEYENKTTDNFNPLEDYVTPTVAEQILQIEEEQIQSFACYEYKIGLDNVRVGWTEYAEQSIYVSKPLFLKEETGVLGLISQEQRPHLNGDVLIYSPESDWTEDKRFLGSAEYWVIKENLDSDDQESATVLNTSTFPILPMGRTEVFHETLVLNEFSGGGTFVTNDRGYLIHIPVKDVTLYRNGTNMGQGGWITAEDPNTGKIQITIAEVNPGDIFTASYAVKLGGSYAADSGDVFLTEDQTVKVGPEGIVLIDESQDERIESYRLYLVIILRKNANTPTATPLIEEYTLAMGKRNLQKFESLT
ncbi:hypothetical protein CMI41_03830 [Candidatus Pacearchaeota archaeon]|nr:hypothetical protein [Candidatus Pacearchaeota archaeon]|tara:strand:+ start:2928 stop:4829 length:1902 start_codon:yes stop_codon:yes gene_type:complete